jgi:hypothetical protein
MTYIMIHDFADFVDRENDPPYDINNLFIIGTNAKKWYRQ